MGVSEAYSLVVINPEPELLTLSVTSATITGSALPITLTGSGFVPNSEVLVQGVVVGGSTGSAGSPTTGSPTAYISWTEIGINLPAALVATAGTYSVVVRNAAFNGQGGGLSDTLHFTMLNPVPELVSLGSTGSPTGDTLQAATGDIQIAVAGAGFVPNSVVMFRGVALSSTNVTYQHPGLLLATLPAALTSTAGTYSVQVQNASYNGQGGGTSNTMQLVFIHPVPQLTMVSPQAVMVARDTVITLTGLGFVPATQVQIAGVTIPDSLVTYKNQTTLEVRLRGGVETANTFADSIRVLNPAPGGGESGALPFSVNSPQAQLVGINPTSLWLHSTGGVVTLLGGNFIPGAVVHLEKNTGEQTTLATTFVNPTTLLVTFAAEEVDSVELYQIKVENPQPTFGISQTQTLKVIRRAPVVQALTPETIQADTQPVVLTLTGDHFVPESEALVDGVAVSTTFVSVTELQFSYNSTLSTTLTVTVQTQPDGITQAGGGASAILPLTLQADVATQAEFTNVPTTIQAGLVLPAFTVSYKDQFGNVTDSETTLTFANADNTSTGTITLTRTALGVSTATQAVFTQAGTYTLSAGGLSMTGNNQITVEAGSAVAQVAVTGLPQTLTAGDNLPAFTLNFTDALANAVEAEAYLEKIQVHILPFGTTATYTITVPVSQSPMGTLTTSPMQVTTAGTYSLKIAGIMDNLISGTTLLTVNPGVATQVEFTGVPTNSVAGETIPTFSVRFSDVYQNPVDVETGVSFTNADNSSTGTITLTRTALGVSTATQVVFTQAGTYTLSAGGLSMTGNNQITIEAGSVVAQVAVTGLPQTLTAGDNMPGWTLNFTDALANAVDAAAYSDKVFLVVNPFGSAETNQVQIPAVQSPQGTLTTSAMQVTTAGTYSVKIEGIADNLIIGTKALTVSPGAITQAEFIGVTTNIVAGETLPTFTVKFSDAHQNPVDVETGISFSNADQTSTGTISLTRTAIGVSTASITTFAQAGDYTLTVDGLQITGNNLITVAPPPHPMPLITAVSIVTGVLSGADIQITINGTGFTPVSDVRLNDVSLTSISYISPTEMTAVIPGAMIVQMENLITVVTPNPGGRAAKFLMKFFEK